MSEKHVLQSEPGKKLELPARRVVLVGASNLTRGISTVIETAQNIWGQPLEVLVAAGHGRSYGLNGVFLGRTLPSILSCGLWEDLSARSNVPTAALVTDIGNDLLFNVEVPQIVGWIETVLDRLQATNARICMTLLPLASAVSVGHRRFRFFRRLYVPGCKLGLDAVLKRTHELHFRLRDLGEARNVRLVQQRADWYGIDPIHIRLRTWRPAWSEILNAWDDHSNSSAPARGSLLRWIYLRTRRPQHRWWLGAEQCQRQPSARLRGGTTVSFY